MADETPESHPPGELEQSQDVTLPSRLGPRPVTPKPGAQGEAPRRADEFIGKYRLVELLGEGGMGSVFLAEQREPVHRFVALKLMRSSLKGAIAVTRFSAERQALARLTHPNIAAMYEAGTTEDGFPYFAMERVEGSPVTAYCDMRRLPLRERLELFRSICEGVLHAHQKGIIHRDLKPTNVLVTEVEGRPVPKIIDFGIAKALDTPLTEATLWTGDGIIGTPAYMSPEALNGGDDLDTRTDVFSLGVMLYELVAGVKPRDTTGLTLAELIRAVSEQETPGPRTRFRSLDAEKREEIASFRSTDPDKLDRALTGDLQWIVARATAREREQRYASAADLAADLARHLSDEPVEAGPPSLRYRAGKFVRRHRWGVAAVALIVLTLVSGAIATTLAMIRAQRAQSEAEAVSTFLTDAIDKASPFNSNRETTVRDLLDVVAKRAPQELREYPAARAQLLFDIGTSQFHLGHSDRADPLLREALRLRVQLYGEQSPLVARVQNVLALVRNELGDHAEAEKLLRESLVIRRTAYGEDHSSIGRGTSDLCGVIEDAGRLAEAEALCREALSMRLRMMAKHIPDVGPREVAGTRSMLARIIYEEGRAAEAEPIMREALRTDLSDYARAKNEVTLGQIVFAQKRYPEAEALFRKAIASLSSIVEPNDMRLAVATTALGQVLAAQGRDAEAEAEYLRALEMEKKSDDVPWSVRETEEKTKKAYAELRERQTRNAKR